MTAGTEELAQVVAISKSFGIFGLDLCPASGASVILLGDLDLWILWRVDVEDDLLSEKLDEYRRDW